MKLLLLAVLVVASSALCEGVTRCGTSLRGDCQNANTALKSGNYEKCLNLWRTSKWVKHSLDVSAECVYCLHIAGSTQTNRSRNILCHKSSSANKETQTKCLDELNELEKSEKTKDGPTYFCNVFNQCHSHTYLGNLDFGASVCEDCKEIIANIRTLVNDNATSEVIVEKVNHLVCNHVCDHLKEYCFDTVKVHVPVVLNLIAIHINPQDICALMNLCPKPSSMILSLNAFLDTNPADNETVPVSHTKCPKATKFSWISRPSAKNHHKWTSKNQLSATGNKNLCEKPSRQQCEEVLEQIRFKLHEAELQKEIEKQADDAVCSILPSFLKGACSSAINEQFDDLIKNMDKIKLEDVCTKFDMVTSSPKVAQALLQPAIPIPGVCQVCEIVFSKIIELIIDKPTEESIKQALEKVCHLVPQSYVERCNSFVDTYGAKIVEAIIAGTAPKLACVSLGLCSTMPMKIAPSSTGYCETCKFLVDLAAKHLSQNETEAEIETYVKKACDVLPASYAGECKTLVDTYVPSMIKYLMEHLSPEEVCERLHLCDSKLIGSLGQGCHRGPDYWCSSPGAMIRCNAQRYCEKLYQNEAFTQDLCKTGSMEDICATDELAANCNRTTDCLGHRMFRYLLVTTQYMQRSTTQNDQRNKNCTICRELLSLLKMEQKLFGGYIVKNSICFKYQGREDRKQCETIMKNRAKIAGKLHGREEESIAICKELSLCTDEKREEADTGFPINLPTYSRAMLKACAEGPKFFCSSKRSAMACGMEQVCEALNWSTDGVMDFCAWGATYWCKSEQTAKQCGQMALDHCRKYVWPVASKQMDRKLCEMNEVFWCQNAENAKLCGKEDYCRQKHGLFSIPYTN